MGKNIPESPKIESEGVNRMFAGIADRYDRANRCLSLGSDVYWRARTVGQVLRAKPARVVDLATGSGDIALALRRKLPPEAEVIGMDFCEEMLDKARSKAREISGVSFRTGDCLDLPLEDEFADACTIGFGLRNLEDRSKGLREMLRIIRPGGNLFILEFSQPHAFLRPFYYFYLKKILPLLASRITGDVDAYHYLGGTIGTFPTRNELSAQIQNAGFSEVTATPLTGGIVAIHRVRKA